MLNKNMKSVILGFSTFVLAEFALAQTIADIADRQRLKNMPEPVVHQKKDNLNEVGKAHVQITPKSLMLKVIAIYEVNGEPKALINVLGNLHVFREGETVFEQMMLKSIGTHEIIISQMCKNKVCNTKKLKIGESI